MRQLTGHHFTSGARSNGEYRAVDSHAADSPSVGPQNPFASAGDSAGGLSSSESTTSRGSSIAHSGQSDSMLAGSGSGTAGSSSEQTDPGARRKRSSYAPSALSSSEFDRYPAPASLLTPHGGNSARYSRTSSIDQDMHHAGRGVLPGVGAAAGGAAATTTTTKGGATVADGNRRTSSYASSANDAEHDPFLVATMANTDFSPFGGYPASDFPLHMDEKENDDYLHNPDPIQDAIEDRQCHNMDRRGWGCLIAFILLIGGAIIVFILLPILDFTGPVTRRPAKNITPSLTPYIYDHLSAVRSNLIDPDTPKSAYTHTSIHGDQWDLVFSDEFNLEGRTFYDGDDQFWQAVDIHYAATQDLEWYDPDAASTVNGTLRLRMDAFRNHDLFYRSGMLQSWNRFCFSQGYVEVSAKLPGDGRIVGLWPGMWTLGNLARPGYLATSDGVWPYSYNDCDAGITPNQSSSDGLNYLPGQRLNKCTCQGSDHPTPGTGRGAPEIDIIEGTVDTPQDRPANPVASQSLQIAPMDIWWMVDYDFIAITNLSVTQMNTWTGGPFQQAVSGTTYLNADWYEYGGKGLYQTYGFEYLNDPSTGYISWYVGQNSSYTMGVGALSPNGNIGWRTISHEPMSIILNLGLSTSWAYIDFLDLVFPSQLLVDYVRVYQPSDSVSVTCDPPGFETTQYIADHPKAYLNANMTLWKDTGYSWPKNSLMNTC